MKKIYKVFLYTGIRIPDTPTKYYYLETKELAQKFCNLKKEQEGTEWQWKEVDVMTNENDFYRKVLK